MRIPSLSALSGGSTGGWAVLAAGILLFAALAFAQSARASDEAFPPPADVSRVAPSHIPPIPEGKYLYKFAWNGIPAAEGEVVVEAKREGEQSYYLLKGAARTSKLADLLWRFRASAAAVVEALSGRAKSIRVSERQNARVKETETVFDYESGEAHYTRWKKDRARKKTISLDGGTIDPAFLGLMVCCRPLEVGDRAAFTVLVGDDPYALEYEVTACERISVAVGRFDALRLEPRFHKIQEEKKPPKVRAMTLWLSKTEPRIPLKMKSKTFIGHVTGELVKMLPPEAETNQQAGAESENAIPHSL